MIKDLKEVNLGLMKKIMKIILLMKVSILIVMKKKSQRKGSGPIYLGAEVLIPH